MENKEKETKEVKFENQVHCLRCGRSDHEGVLLPCRYNGESQWVCTRCLPVLIHG